MFLRHVYNMSYIRFDYGYNMKLNIAVGAVNSLCWLGWCFLRRGRLRHVRSCAAAVLALNVSVLLELLDFAPLLWTLDSHALWHLTTAPIHLVWYDFVIRDCAHLARQRDEYKRLA